MADGTGFDNAFLSNGETYVIDLDEVGLAVTIKSVDSGRRELEVELEYVAVGSSNHDDGVAESHCNANSISVSDSTITKFRTVDDGVDGEVVNFDAENVCGEGNIYVYKEYPVGVIEFNAAPAVGALHVQPLEACAAGGSGGGGDACAAAGGIQVTDGYSNIDGWYAYETDDSYGGFRYSNPEAGVYIQNSYDGYWGFFATSGGLYERAKGRGGKRVKRAVN